jgi:phosphatidylserine decarboxylase
VCDLKEGQQVTCGEKFGMIKFGSRTEVFVERSRLQEMSVRKGDRVFGGLTVLGRLKLRGGEDPAPTADSQKGVGV